MTVFLKKNKKKLKNKDYALIASKSNLFSLY